MKVQNEMATKITVDTVQAAKSISAFRNGISALTNSWKANEMAYRTAGDSLNALKSRYEGISNVIELQKQKIDELKNRQEGLDRTNKDQANTWLKLEKDIQTATRQLASYEAQQAKAKTSMNYYNNGLADLQKSYRTTQALSKSYVERLRAEGRELDATKAQLSGVKNALNNLNNQYQLQEKELESIASKTGMTSEAYMKQKTRLNETATAIAKTKNKFNELNSSLKEQPTTFFGRLKDQVLSFEKQTEKVNNRLSKFKEKMNNTFVAVTASNAIGTLTGSFSNLISESFRASDAMDKFKSTMQLGGFGSKEIQKVSKEVRKYADDTVYELNDVSNTTAQLAANGVKNYMKLTEAAGNLNAQAGGNAETFKSVAMVMTQTAGAGKLTTENWNQLADAIPGASGKLQEAMKKNGAYTGNFRDAMEKGQISAKEFNKAIMDLGSTDSAEKAAKNTATIEGAVGNLEAAVVSGIQNIIDTFGKSNFTNVINETTKSIENISTKIGNFLKENKEPIQGIVDSISIIFKTVGNAIWKTFSNTIETIGKAFGVVGENSSKTNSTLETIDLLLKKIASHKKAIDLLTKSLIGLWTVNKGRKILSNMIFKPKVDSKDAKRELTLFGRIARKTGTSVKKALKWVAKVAVSGAKKALNVLKQATIATGKGIGKALKWTAKISTKAAKAALSGLSKAAVVTGKAVKVAFNGMLSAAKKLALGFKAVFLSNPFGIAILAITALGVAFYELYKHNKKFKKFVNGLVKDAKKAFDNIIKFFKSLPKEISKVWKNITGFFSKGWKSIKDTTNKSIKNTQKSWNKFNKDVAKSANNMWKDTKKKFSNGWNSLKKNADNGKDKIVKSWNNLNNTTLNVAKKMAKENPKQFKSGYDAIQSYTNIWKDFTSGHWDKLGGDINDTAKNIRKFTKNIFKDMYDWLNDKTGGRLDDMVNTFTDKFGQLKDIVGSAVKGVKHKAVDLVNGVVKPFNDMLGGLKKGINWVLDKVGAPQINASWAIPTVSYAKGTADVQGSNGTHQGGLALVNDGVGEHYREMFRLPNGKVGIFPKQRNMVVPLPKGSSVLNGEDTYKLTTMLGIPAYANGIGKFFKGVWNSAVDLVDEAEDILKKPAEFLKEVFEKHIGNLSAKGLAGDIITNFPNKLASLAVDWVKKLFEDFGAGGDGNSPAGRMAKSEFAKIAKHAARLMHQKLSERDIEHLYYQASTESGVDPAQNGGYDDHDGTGLPIGLFQYKLGTWRSWAVPGHANIHSALDQIMAVLNDSNWRNDFPPIGVKRGWGPSGHRMMAYGGRIDTNQLIEVAENNKPEYIIPTDPVKRPRAWQLMHELTSEFTKQDPGHPVSRDNRDIKELNDKFDSLLAMFSQLLGLNSQQIKAIRESGFDKTKQYQQQALDQRLADYQGY
ncbi:tape measure protein [Ligilactobacillus salivarius]|uniref:tape measure protein n=1 Tax=Ligilactobacillus salivarius TaxID=1624 RepID=UPI001F017997|nr:tape measure protein [Ligilactobacillus salivarius]